MMPKPEISLKKIINYSNNRVYTKRTNRNYKYKRKKKIFKLLFILIKPYIFFYKKKIYSLIFSKGISDIKQICVVTYLYI